MIYFRVSLSCFDPIATTTSFRRQFLPTLGLVIATFFLAILPKDLFGSESSSARVGDKPNIIFCMTDDQGWGDTGYNGHPELKTPNLDAMAAAGIRFDRFYAAHPMCSPSRASALTGRSPVRYLSTDWGHDLPLREVTYAEAAREAGYATGHFGKWHLGGIPGPSPTGRGLPASFCPEPRHPGNQGFDEWFTAANWFDIEHEHLYPPMPPSPIYHNGVKVPILKGDTSDIIVDRAVRWIREQSENGKPFVAVVWFTSPHGPHKALPKDAAPYAKYGGEKANYYGEMAGVDRSMGRLREALREMEVAENTMLWFCSDNGGFYFRPLSTGGLSGFKGILSEGGTRVPGILEWPARVKKPFVTSVPASTMDFYPTVLDLLSITMPDHPGPIDGISLLPLIDGKMERRPKPIPLVGKRGTQEVRVVDNEFTLQNGQLYRLAGDGRTECTVTNPEVKQRLTTWERQWLQSVYEDQAAYVVEEN